MIKPDFDTEIEKYLTNKTTIEMVNINDIPNISGIYIVECPENFKIEFTDKPITIKEKVIKGKLRNIIYPVEELYEKYENGNKRILNIGKTNCKEGLQRRLQLYLEYGQGKDVAHRGGRSIWQIINNQKLNLYWYPTENARKLEKYLIQLHSQKYPAPLGKDKHFGYPLANRQG